MDSPNSNGGHRKVRFLTGMFRPHDRASKKKDNAPSRSSSRNTSPASKEDDRMLQATKNHHTIPAAAVSARQYYSSDKVLPTTASPVDTSNVKPDQVTDPKLSYSKRTATAGGDSYLYSEYAVYSGAVDEDIDIKAQHFLASFHEMIRLQS